MANLSEKLRSYFLGELSAEEAVRLENEYLGDNAKFAELREAENDLLDDYVYQKLPPKIRESFEVNYLNSPFRQQRLEFAQTLARYLHNRTDSSQTVEQHRFTWIDIFSFWKIAVVTAPILLFIIGGFWVFNNSLKISNNDVAVIETTEVLPVATPQIIPKTEPTPSQSAVDTNATKPNVSPTPRPIASPTPIRTEPNQTVILALSAVGMRDGGKTSQAIIDKDTRNVFLKLNLGDSEAKKFQIQIVNADGTTIYQTSKTRSAGNKINLSLPANLLKNDDYVVEISTANSDGVTEKILSYSFRIIKK